MESMKNLSNWVFIYNPNMNRWLATKRDHYTDLFNNLNSPHILKSSEISTLVYLIKRTNGDKTKLNRIVQ